MIRGYFYNPYFATTYLRESIGRFVHYLELLLNNNLILLNPKINKILVKFFNVFQSKLH